MNDDKAQDGGIYEPIRKLICGEGECSGKNLELYRTVIQTMKQVSDAIAIQAYNVGVDERNAAIKKVAKELDESCYSPDQHAVFPVLLEKLGIK